MKPGIVLSIALLLSSLLNVNFVRADTDEGSALWLMSFSRFKFENNLRAFLEVQPRISVDDPAPGNDGDIRTVIYRGALGYQIDQNFSAYFGYAVIPLYEPTKVEHRIFQELFSSHDHESWKIINRFRLEERFLEGVDDMQWRARHQLRAQRALSFCEGVSLAMSDEVFINLNDINTAATQGFDQNRLFFGVNYKLSDRLSMDLGYLNQYVERRAGSNDLITHNIFLGFISQFDFTS
jgi:hypothetical protein